MSAYGTGGPGVGPYGTNLGDTWLAEGSAIQDKLDREGKGLKLIHEVILGTTGKREERVFVTADADLIAEAREGSRFYWLARASEN